MYSNFNIFLKYVTMCSKQIYMMIRRLFCSQHTYLLTLNRGMVTKGGIKPRVLSPPLLFRFLLEVFVVWPRFKVRQIPLDLENILHTQNVGVGCIKNFLKAFEVKVFFKKRQNPQNFLEFGKAPKIRFSKICLEVTFSSIKAFLMVQGSLAHFKS